MRLNLPFLLTVSVLLSRATAHAPSSKPNILAIFAADVGVSSIGACQRGMMGGRTPNINRIANKGALFTDYNAQQSCTAGRSALLAGQTRPVEGRQFEQFAWPSMWEQKIININQMS